MNDDLKQKLEFLISCLDYHLKEAWIEQTTIKMILHNVLSDYAAVFHDLEFVPLNIKKNPDDMSDIEYLKQVGIEFPKDFTFTQQDWKDFYTTLSSFKIRCFKRKGLDPTEPKYPYKRSERGS